MLTSLAGWAWPALTRNPSVHRIFRVDPDAGQEVISIRMRHLSMVGSSMDPVQWHWIVLAPKIIAGHLLYHSRTQLH